LSVRALRRVLALDEFVVRARELCEASPEDARYSVKYSHKLGNVVARITNDRICLTYKTDQSVDVFKLNQLSEWFLSSCTGVKRVRGASIAEEEAAANAEANAPPAKLAKVQAAAALPAPPPVAQPAAPPAGSKAAAPASASAAPGKKKGKR
jgi:signal recognition particle subunit SRP9